MLASTFETTGILLHTTTCHGRFCRTGQGLEREKSGAWLAATLRSDWLIPSIERDCGEWCSAYAFQNSRLPFSPFSFAGYQSGLALVYAATDEVWQQMQCLSVTDSSSTTRACCACFDPSLCPFNNFEQRDSGYCGAPCGTHDDNCRQLAAACGPSVWDLAGRANEGSLAGLPLRPQDEWGRHECNVQQISRGKCELCKQPLWCESYKGGDGKGITRPHQWIDAFWRRDAGAAFGSRQCKFRPNQTDLFIDTMRLRHTKRRHLPTDWRGIHYDNANPWNEVNMYVHPGDHAQQELMFRNLIGLLYLRTSGNDDDLANVRRLHEHWRQLGRDVPMFAVNAEPLDRVEHWTPEGSVDLRQWPYGLEQLF